MRRLTLLLCLLMVAAFRSIIGSTEALTTTEPKEAVLPKTHVTLEAVNTGFKASLVAASIRAEDGVLITRERLPAAIDQVCVQLSAVLSRSNRRVEFEFIEIVAGSMIENLPPTSDRA